MAVTNVGLNLPLTTISKLFAPKMALPDVLMLGKSGSGDSSRTAIEENDPCVEESPADWR
jgi:hypothetical protein